MTERPAVELGTEKTEAVGERGGKGEGEGGGEEVVGISIGGNWEDGEEGEEG